jgi:hypothetical protein
MMDKEEAASRLDRLIPRRDGEEIHAVGVIIKNDNGDTGMSINTEQGVNILEMGVLIEYEE